MLPKPYVPREPQVDKIWVVVPFSRAAHIIRALDNFDRQSFPGKRLILIENGAAVGTAQRRGSRASSGNYLEATILTSRHHQSAAKNEAIAFIRSKGGGFFTTMDDDDWYGPEYLAELSGIAKTADVIGKTGHFVSIGEGDLSAPPLLLCTNIRYANAETKWVHGGTLSGFAETALEYREMKEGEELDYAARALQSGMTIRSSSVFHYLYRRHYYGAHHTWRCSRKDYQQLQWSLHALELPEFDPEYVTAARPITRHRLFDRGEFKTVAPHLRLVTDSLP